MICLATARDLGTRANVRREDVTQFRGVGLGQVDLVLNAVEGELDGLLGVTAVEVIDQLVNDLLGHAPLSFRASTYHENNNWRRARSVNGGWRIYRHHCPRSLRTLHSGR